MARVYKEHGHEFREITSKGGRFSMSFVPELGGIGTSLRLKTAAGDRELLWLHQDFWKEGSTSRYGGWPFLFPICGRLERACEAEYYLYKGKRYKMPIHGFASRQAWRVSDERDDFIQMVLVDTQETREQYPFSFQVSLSYSLSDDGLLCEQTYANTGHEPMPYYAGFHPYFATPRPDEGKDLGLVDFSPVERYVYNERLTDVVDTVPALSFPERITEPGINEQLHRMPAGGNCSRLSLPDGTLFVLEAHGQTDPALFPFIQLFTQKEHPFFCMEPWMGTPNMLNTVAGSRWLQPGQEERGTIRVQITRMP